ncbi:LysR family transcriptional regulator [Roseococcus sp. YIM B11640]|uniref:LysR family transcriptional regulator n=1 Tax=Roseococcus sp. YIM B11640 TaxID=3133973 RepID=UPI003C7BAF11
MLKMDGIAAFVAVVDAGSISGAGRALGLSKSVVSERLAELERLMDARLLNRTTRHLALTEDGESLLPRARRILGETEEAMAEAAARRGQLSGRLRISGPVSFGTLHLGPALHAFLREHPAIELSLELEDRFVDIAGEGFDAVVRHGPAGDGWLIATRLAPSRRLLVASPDYLARNGEPRSLAELGAHRAILYSNRAQDWSFRGPDGPVILRPRGAMRVNHGIMMRDAALAGLGITLLPSFIAHDAIRAGALRVLDVGARAEGADVYIIHRGEGGSAKLRALIRHLRHHFGVPPHWERDLPA